MEFIVFLWTPTHSDSEMQMWNDNKDFETLLEDYLAFLHLSITRITVREWCEVFELYNRALPVPIKLRERKR